MIKLSNWTIEAIGAPFGRQYDNLTRHLDVCGDIPPSWSWDALLQFGDNLNIITLSAGDDGLHADLTAETLAFNGVYRLQLRATNGELVRHTNIIPVNVAESLSGDAKWPELPSEFSQAEARIRELNEHPPVPGENGYWMLWDPDRDIYVESDIPLPAGGGGGGYRIGDGLKLDPETNTLSVDTANAAEQDNTKPITSAAVFTTVGNIEVILKTI